MDTMESLVWSDNPLGGNIPVTLKMMENLKVVPMAKNGLTSGVPTGVLDLGNLTEFDVPDN